MFQRLVGVAQAGPGHLDGGHEALDGLVLAEHDGLELLFELPELLLLVALDLAGRHLRHDGQDLFEIVQPDLFLAPQGHGGAGTGQQGATVQGHGVSDRVLWGKGKQASVGLHGQNLADDTYVASCLGRGDCFYGARRSVYATVSYRY